MMSRRRRGKPSRRQLEFEVVRHHVKKNKVAFIARLQRNVEVSGDCVLWRGSKKSDGYARLNFRYKGGHVQIDAHRLFLILQIAQPIPQGFEAGHRAGCPHRNCVRHVFLQHYKDNLAARDNGKETDDTCPF